MNERGGATSGMSERDEQILKRAHLSQSEAAKLIGVHRQSISRGIKNPDSNYLTIDSLLTISSRLSKSNDDRSAIVRELIVEYYPKSEALVDELLKGIDDVNPAHTVFEELWVFSPLPKECSSTDYLKYMLEFHFLDPQKTIIYFTPPGFVSEQLKSVLSRTLEGRDPNATASILIFSTKISLYSPHFSVLDPGHQSSGWVLTKSGRFYSLPDRQVEDTVVAVRQAGIGIVSFDQLAEQANTKEPNNLFTMEYWNHAE